MKIKIRFLLSIIFFIVCSASYGDNTKDLLHRVEATQHFVVGYVKQINNLHGTYRQLIIEVNGEEKSYIFDEHYAQSYASALSQLKDKPQASTNNIEEKISLLDGRAKERENAVQNLLVYHVESSDFKKLTYPLGSAIQSYLVTDSYIQIFSSVYREKAYVLAKAKYPFVMFSYNALDSKKLIKKTPQLKSYKQSVFIVLHDAEQVLPLKSCFAQSPFLRKFEIEAWSLYSQAISKSAPEYIDGKIIDKNRISSLENAVRYIKQESEGYVLSIDYVAEKKIKNHFAIKIQCITGEEFDFYTDDSHMVQFAKIAMQSNVVVKVMSYYQSSSKSSDQQSYLYGLQVSALQAQSSSKTAFSSKAKSVPQKTKPADVIIVKTSVKKKSTACMKPASIKKVQQKTKNKEPKSRQKNQKISLKRRSVKK